MEALQSSENSSFLPFFGLLKLLMSFCWAHRLCHCIRFIKSYQLKLYKVSVTMGTSFFIGLVQDI